LRSSGQAGLDAFVTAGGTLSSPRVRELVEALAQNGPALFPLVLSDPELLDDVLKRPLEENDREGYYQELFQVRTSELGAGPTLERILRRLRHREVVRIALREILSLADVDQTSAEMASLASAAVDSALSACTRSVEEEHGAPLDELGRPVRFCALGMGKLGGR